MENYRKSIFSNRSWWHELAYWSLLVAACIVMYVMNTWTSFKEDDMELSLLRDAGFADFWRAQLDHYLTTNGRCSDFFATLFCAYLGKPLFNIVNALIFGVMAHLVCLLSTGRRSVLALSMFIAVVVTCFPVPGQTMLFVAGSCNYMWSIVASLLVVLLLQRCQDTHPSKGKTALIMLLALLAGNFNEATSLGFLAGMALYYAFNRSRLNRLVILVLAAYALGALLIVASPAAWHRASAGVVVNLGVKDLLMTRGYNFAKLMSRIVTPVLAVMAGVIIWAWKGFKPLRQCVWAYILPFLIMMMIILGYPYDRAYAPMATVSTIILAMLADKLLENKPWLRIIGIIACLAACALFFPPKMNVLADLKHLEDEINSEIVSAPRQAILRERHFKGYSTFATPLSYESKEFFNREAIYRAYYDKDNVQFVSDSVYNRYHSGRLLHGSYRLPLVSDRPEIANVVLGFADQDYMIVIVKGDTLPASPQQAVYHLVDPEKGLTKLELKMRKRYGVSMDFAMHGYYPIFYQGQQLLVFPLIDDATSSISFQLDDENRLGEMTLTRQQSDSLSAR